MEALNGGCVRRLSQIRLTVEWHVIVLAWYTNSMYIDPNFTVGIENQSLKTDFLPFT